MHSEKLSAKRGRGTYDSEVELEEVKMMCRKVGKDESHKNLCV